MLILIHGPEKSEQSAKLSVLMIYKIFQSVDLGVQNLCNGKTC